MSRTEPGLCWFGLQRLPPLLAAFTQEIEGVKEARDIEHIHRMRVASRRLRAALPLFRTCFPAKQYMRWMHEIAIITRALGEARDTDVQIAYLTRYGKKSAAAWKSRNGESPAGENPAGPAIRYLMVSLQKRRSTLQTRVLAALDALEKSGVIDEIRATIVTRSIPFRCALAGSMMYGIPTVAALRIESRLVTMLSFEPWVSHPDAVAEHHAMRIAAKKLRYTMEVYGPVYRLGLQKPLARVKKVQEILGDLHDCDVWIDHVTRILLRERGHLRLGNDGKRPDTGTLAALRLFLREREKGRIFLHRRFMRYWGALRQAGIFGELQQTLITGRKKRFSPGGQYDERGVRTAVGSLAAGYPEGLDHARNVTRLALMLFDCLRPVLDLDDHDRFLLEMAAMLHDIGWQDGQRRHNARSARRVFESEALPLDIADRVAIGLAAQSHRGRARPWAHPLFPLLSEEFRRKIVAISAILRIADGLDYLHLGHVQEVRCIAEKEAIFCEIISPADVTVEKERARARSDLFSEFFGRTMVIR